MNHNPLVWKRRWDEVSAKYVRRQLQRLPTWAVLLVAAIFYFALPAAAVVLLVYGHLVIGLWVLFLGAWNWYSLIRDLRRQSA